MRVDGMGRKRIVGLEWLDPINTEQRLWARAYLLTKGFEKHFHFRDKVLPTELPSHQEMLHAGMAIEQKTGARELFRDMKDAWRQEKSRNKKKETGRQVCAFTLNSATKAMLDDMARELGTNATALLEKMISKAHKSHTSKAKKQNPTQSKPEKTARNTYGRGGHPSTDKIEVAQSPAFSEDNTQTNDASTSGHQETGATAPAADTHDPVSADNQELTTQDDRTALDSYVKTDTPIEGDLSHNAEWAKKSISDLLTLRAENKAARAKQARPPSPPSEQIATTTTGADSPPTTRSDEQS